MHITQMTRKILFFTDIANRYKINYNTKDLYPVRSAQTPCNPSRGSSGQSTTNFFTRENIHTCVKERIPAFNQYFK